MKEKCIIYYLLTLSLVFTNSVFAQNDLTPDSWEDNVNIVETESEVLMRNDYSTNVIRRFGIGSIGGALMNIQAPPLGNTLYAPMSGLKIQGRMNQYAAQIFNDFVSEYAGGLLIETNSAHSHLAPHVDALRVVTRRHTAPQVVFRVRNYSTSGNQVLLVEEGGKVGIGMNTPEHELDICGFARAKEIIVETDWCDYVFEKEYPLPSLKEQKDFITKNGHLKNFESEKEMAGQLQVGDIQKRQQQTIEEMMLYLIEMEAEIKSLKAEVEALKRD